MQPENTEVTELIFRNISPQPPRSSCEMEKHDNTDAPSEHSEEEEEFQFFSQLLDSYEHMQEDFSISLSLVLSLSSHQSLSYICI